MIVGGSDQVLIVVLFYFLITMIVGLLPFGKKRVDSLDNFHSATKGISDWCFVFCVLSTIYTSSTWTGCVPLTTQIGIYGIYTTVYIAIAAFLYGIISPKVYDNAKESSIFSLGGYLEHRLHSHGINIFVSIVSIVVGAIWIVMELKSLGIIICAAFNYSINFVSAVIMGLLVIVVYIIWGGMESAVWSACLHGIIMIFGGIIISIMLVVYQYGSLSDFLLILKNNADIVELNYHNFSKMGDFPQWISNAIVSALGMVCLPQIFSRMVMGKSEQSQKKIAKWIGISALWCLSFVLIGYVAMIEDLQVTQSSNLIFEIMALSDHTWVLYLTYIVMMAAAMGTLDITLFSLSTIIITTFVSDSKILESRYNKKKKYTYVTLSRIVIVIVAMLCMIIAIVLDDNLTDMAINSYQYICQIFPTLMYAAFSKNKKTRVAFFAMGSGFLVTVILEISAISLIMTSGVWGLIVNSIIIIANCIDAKRKRSHL